jgi:hypothetical protein
VDWFSAANLLSEHLNDRYPWATTYASAAATANWIAMTAMIVNHDEGDGRLIPGVHYLRAAHSTAGLGTV